MLVLVVGPSGAGKDTVIGMARRVLAGDARFRFVRRVVTREADAGGEDHEAVSEADFAQRPFALQWQAHGLSYGIPADVGDDVRRGIVVVANVSRGVIAGAAGRYRVRVMEITAPPDILARRLSERGRETADDIRRRLLREVAIPHGVPVDRVVNDRTPAEAARDFMAALLRVGESVQRV